MNTTENCILLLINMLAPGGPGLGFSTSLQRNWISLPVSCPWLWLCMSMDLCLLIYHHCHALPSNCNETTWSSPKGHHIQAMYHNTSPLSQFIFFMVYFNYMGIAQQTACPSHPHPPHTHKNFLIHCKHLSWTPSTSPQLLYLLQGGI